MTNQQLLQLIAKGSKAWNEWRFAHPSVKPALVGLDLHKRSLRNFDLSGVDFTSADLRDVSFRRANLTDATLDHANLYRSFFSGTKLQGASLKGVILYETVFANVNLSVVRSLAECVHKGPSVVDHRTLARSRALPLSFLRGCGLPDEFIAEVLQTSPKAQQYWPCFLSYSSRDQEFAERLYADLQAHGVRCWFAPKDMEIGAKIRDSIDDAIRGTGKVVVILSESSMASSWVEKEFETTFEEEQRRDALLLFPIRLDSSPLSSTKSWVADIRRVRNIGDFSDWRDEAKFRTAFARLLRSLARSADSDA